MAKMIDNYFTFRRLFNVIIEKNLMIELIEIYRMNTIEDWYSSIGRLCNSTRYKQALYNELLGHS